MMLFHEGCGWLLKEPFWGEMLSQQLYFFLGAAFFAALGLATFFAGAFLAAAGFFATFLGLLVAFLGLLAAFLGAKYTDRIRFEV